VSRRHFSALLFISLALVGLLLVLVPGKTEREAGGGGLLLQDVESWINEVDSLVITGSGDREPVHLKRGDRAWTIAELYDYPVDWEQLRTLLADLAESEIVEIKTARPEYYSRLGVDDVGSEGATGVLLELQTGENSTGIIIGDRASSRDGQYVRLLGSEQSVLIDRTLNAGTDPVSWADRGLVDIGSALVAEMQIRHADGDEVVIRKVSADDTDFSLQDLPQDRKTRSSWTINSLANNFSLLTMEGVMPEADLKQEASVSISLLTFSGLKIEAEIFDVEEQGWIRLKALAPDAEPEIQEQAESINRRLDGWVYRISKMKFEAMTRRKEQLLEAADQGESS
jgi:hypothetical protein